MGKVDFLRLFGGPVRITHIIANRLAERRLILPNKHPLTSKRFWLLTVCFICAIGVLLVVQSPVVVAGEKAKGKGMNGMKAYKVYQQKCARCNE